MLKMSLVKKPEKVDELEDYVNKEILKNIPILFNLSFCDFLSIISGKKPEKNEFNNFINNIILKNSPIDRPLDIEDDEIKNQRKMLENLIYSELPKEKKKKIYITMFIAEGSFFNAEKASFTNPDLASLMYSISACQFRELSNIFRKQGLFYLSGNAKQCEKKASELEEHLQTKTKENNKTIVDADY